MSTELGGVESESVDGELKNDSGKRRRYVLVYKEDSDEFGNGLDSDAELVKEESKVVSVENVKLNESDLVWGKVRSYPWWPGQVVDVSVASKMAKKHFKEGKLLVAYFGDGSFAWNDEVKIKPFHKHFEKMVVQSKSVEFCDAVDFALEEVERRVVFGLSCGCVSEEEYMKVKTQNIVNAGISEESRVRYGGDKVSDVMFFEPGKLVEYMRHLACFPRYDVTEKLELVSYRAQLLAFEQWKGYPSFLEYETFPLLVESTVPEVFVLEPNTDEEMFSKKRKDYKDKEEQKERIDFVDITDDEKPLSDFIGKKRSGSKSTKKFDGKLRSEKKRKVESSVSGKSEKKIKNSRKMEDSVTPNSYEGNNLSVGEAKREELARKKTFSHDEMLSSPYSAKTKEGIPEPIIIDYSNFEDLDQYMKDISCSNVDDDSKTSEPIDVSDTSDEQIVLANEDITDSGKKEQTVKDSSSAPIAMILNFADSGSIPSVEKLNKAFNCYGPLRESETKVMKKSARVVFKRREDAETAFSSAGKYSIFGPALLSYKLKFV